MANITHGTITFLCADNAVQATDAVRAHQGDVMWWTTRIRAGTTHHHHDNGTCIPKVYRLRKDGAYSPR